MHTEKETTVESPYTGGKVTEVQTVEKMDFRGEDFYVHTRYYLCKDTGERFTDTEQDEATLNDLYSQYRIKHGIPFPEEIRAIRQRYGLNHTKINKLMGFGVNQWAKYENGQVPSDSNGRLIAAMRRKEVALGLIRDLRPVFEDDEFAKILSSVLASPEEDIKEGLNSIMYEGTSRSLENGYAPFDHRKIEAMVKYLAGSGKCATQLNKEMFYSDFQHFRNHGTSISGLRYQAIQFGPVPVHYSTIYDHVPQLDKVVIVRGNLESIVFKCQTPPDLSIFSHQEQMTLEEVKNKLDALSVSEIVELSHKEPAWLKNYPHKGIIPYSEAYNLSGL